MLRNRKNIDNLIGFSLYLMAGVVIFLIVRTALGDDIWYDEVYSLDFAKKSFSDIVSFTARDVHPPLYYFYLKIVTLFGGMIAPSVSYIVWGKFASFIPWVLLLILSVTKIRKRFGIITSGLFLLLITAMPQVGNYYIEIRMYSFALLLITTAFVALLGIIDNPSKQRNYIVFFLMGIMTAYTQYYALIGIIGLYIVFFIHLSINRSLKEKKIYIMAGASIALYIPWLPSFLNQVSNVSSNYWIQPLNLRSLLGCVKFMFLPSGWGGWQIYTITALMIIATLITYVLFFLGRPDRKEIIIALSGTIVLGTVILSGFVLSILGRPIFVYRYMIPVYGVFYLSLAFMLSKVIKRRSIMAVLIIIYAVGGYYSASAILSEENNKLLNEKSAMEAINAIPEGSVIITNFDHVTALMDYYRNDLEIYLYEGAPDPLIGDMFNKNNQSIQRDDIKPLVDEHDLVYFLGSFNTREDILNDWSTLGINYEELNSILIERYWINIYQLRAAIARI